MSKNQHTMISRRSALTASLSAEPTMIRRPKSIVLTDKGAAVAFAYRLSQALETLGESEAVDVMYLFVNMLPAHLRAGSSATALLGDAHA